MQKSFSSIFKKRKIIFSLLLLFVLMGVTIPHGAHASWASDLWDSTFGLLTGSVMNTIAKNGVNAITAFFMAIPVIISGIFSFIASTLLIWILKLVMEVVSYTSLDKAVNPAVSVGWPIVRNFANIGIVVGLIVIALATILRLEMFGDRKKLLIRLVVAALLINFSLVICGIVIDISNITTKYLLSGGSGGTTTTVGSFISQSEWDNSLKVLKSAFGREPVDSPEVLLSKLWGQIFVNMMKGIVGFLYVFLFLFRIMALWILVILSPLAFAAAVFPQTKSMIFDKWLSNFLQWCFIGVFGALFLFLGTEINKEILSISSTFLNFNTTGGLLESSTYGEFFKHLTKLMQFFIPGMFMIIGFIFSLQCSAMGASLATSLGKKAGIGAAKFTGKVATKTMEVQGNWIGQKIGLLDKGETLKGKAIDLKNRAVEYAGSYGIGSAGAGYAEAEKRKRLQPSRQAEEAAAAQDAKERQQSIEAGPGLSDVGRGQYMANFERAMEKGELKNMDPVQLKKAMDTYSSITGKTDIYSKAGGADYAQYDTNATDELMRTEKLDENDAIKLLKAKTFKTQDKKWMDNKTERELDTIGEEDTDKGAQVREMYIREGKQNRLFGGNKNQLEDTVRDDIAEYGISTNLLSKLHPDSAAYDTDKIKEILIKKGLVFETGKTNSATAAQVDEAATVAIKEAWQNYKIDTSTATDNEVIKKAKEATAEGAKFLQEALKRNILGTIEETYRDAAVANGTKYGVRPQDLEEKDYHYAPNNPSRTGKLKKNNPRNISGGETIPAYEVRIGNMAKDQVLNSTITKMSGDQLREIDTPDITPDRIEILTPDKIYEFQFASQDKKDQLERVVRPELSRRALDINREYQKALKALPPEPAKAEQLFDKLNKLNKLIKAIDIVTL